MNFVAKWVDKFAKTYIDFAHENGILGVIQAIAIMTVFFYVAYMVLGWTCVGIHRLVEWIF